MENSSSQSISSYSPPAQSILYCLQLAYGEGATRLALQALEVLVVEVESQSATTKSLVSQQKRLQPFLITAYQQAYKQTGQEWVQQALLYNGLRTLEPKFTFKPKYKTWPKFLQAQSYLFECQVMHEQLHVRLKPTVSQ